VDKDDIAEGKDDIAVLKPVKPKPKMPFFRKVFKVQNFVKLISVLIIEFKRIKYRRINDALQGIVLHFFLFYLNFWERNH